MKVIVLKYLLTEYFVNQGYLCEDIAFIKP